MSISSSLAHRRGTGTVLSSLFNWVIYAAFFLVPLFFLPFTSSVLEQNKQVLLVLLTVIALVVWFGSMVMKKECAFKSGWWQAIPGAFLLVVLVSSILSVSHYQSWIGQSGQQFTSFLTIAVFVALFYFLLNNATDTKVQQNILFSVLLSSVLVGLIATLSMFHLYSLPFAFAQSVGFNTVGIFTSYVLYMIPVMFIGLAMWLVGRKEDGVPVMADGGQGQVTRVLIVLLVLMTVVALLAVDYWIPWLITILGVLLLAAFGFLQTNEFPNPKRFAVPLLILLVSVLFFFLPSPLKVKIPVSVSPSFGASWQVAKSTLGSNTREFIVGSGPGTFVYDFLAAKPIGVNATQFWSVGFDQAKSFFLTELATLGILGALIWVVLFGWILVKTVGKLLREREYAAWKMMYVLFVGWVLLLVSQFLAYSNFTLSFLFWGLTGLLASHVFVSVWKTDFSKSPKIGLIVSFVFVIVGVGILGSVFITGRYYMAELAFAKAIQLDRAKASSQDVVKQLATAVRYNNVNDVYYRNLSAGLLRQGQEVLGLAKDGKLTDEQNKKLSQLVTAAVNSAQKATQIEPNRVANWVMLGSVYRNLMPYVQNAEDQAANAYTNAIKLEPTNPSHRTELGRVYLTIAERAKNLKTAKSADLAKSATEQEQKNLTSAEQMFMAAIQLKRDYLPAHYYLAAVYERQGKLDDAMARLEAISKTAPNDVGVGFQLAQMYIRLQKYDLAQKELERIIVVSPKYSNALWYLASVFELENNPAKAVENVRKVVGLNPDNKVAKQRLEKLEAGERTISVPEPIQSGQGSVSDKDESDQSAAESDTTASDSEAKKNQ